MFVTVNQCKQVIGNYLQHAGQGGFLTGIVQSTEPLTIQAGKLELPEELLYITDNCIGLIMHLRHDHECQTCGKVEEALQNDVVLRPSLEVGDGVLLLCRPDNMDGVKYIVLDRIQKYEKVREVDAR